jgi:hypothetical protein
MSGCPSGFSRVQVSPGISGGGGSGSEVGGGKGLLGTGFDGTVGVPPGSGPDGAGAAGSAGPGAGWLPPPSAGAG